MAVFQDRLGREEIEVISSDRDSDGASQPHFTSAMASSPATMLGNGYSDTNERSVITPEPVHKQDTTLTFLYAMARLRGSRARNDGFEERVFLGERETLYGKKRDIL